MLNIFETKKRSLNYKGIETTTPAHNTKFKVNNLEVTTLNNTKLSKTTLNKDTSKIDKENTHLLNRYEKEEYENTIYYPSSSKEWFSSIYSYNKSYIKPLISHNFKLNEIFSYYCNMLLSKIKILFKRRRHNKSRYSGDKIYVSRAELKHTNTKILIILYTFNKKKISMLRNIKKLILLTNNIKTTKIDKTIDGADIEYVVPYKNRAMFLLKKNFFVFKKLKMTFFKMHNNLLKYFYLNIKKKNDYKIYIYNLRFLKKLFKLQKTIFDLTKLIHFNRSKFNNLVLELKNLGLINLIKKIYNKKVEIQLVELKSIHLNSDVFSSAVALKLRDRHNNAVRVLRRAVLQMVKIPDLHTLITFDDTIDTMNKNNILKTIKQQIVSGVRFEASGRLTRRLTAMRAVFKYRYVGSLKNIRSSFNNKSSSLLRGYVKANSQYTLINSKTRNGAFGLKGWVSSH